MDARAKDEHDEVGHYMRSKMGVRYEADAMPGVGANARVLASAVIALALCACALLAVVPQTRAYADSTARIEVSQRYLAEWTGLADTFQYCLEAVTPAAPLPEPTAEGDKLMPDEGKFCFAMHRNDFDDTAQHPARELLIVLDSESDWVHASRIDYRLYVSSLPEADFGYRRYYDGASEGSDSSGLALGSPDEQRAKMIEATSYNITLYPSASPADGDVFITYGNAQGRKVADPGWEIEFERTDGTVRFLPNRSRLATQSSEGDEGMFAEQSADEEVQTWRLGETRNLRKNTFVNDGYRFTSWNTSPDGSGVAYADEQSFYMTPDGLTLYAQWASMDAGAAGAGQGVRAEGQAGNAGAPGQNGSDENPLAHAVQSMFPKTGDSQAIAITAAVLAGVALAAMAVVILACRRRKGGDDAQQE